MSRDMVLTCLGTSFSCLGSLRFSFEAAWLVVLGGVEGQVTEEFAVAADDPDVQVVGEDVAADAGQEAAEPDVVQAAVVAQGDRSGLVDHIAAEPVVVGDRRVIRCQTRVTMSLGA
jgi:hypothetical protein